jgi:ligand-binding sensor domain-containing protein
MSIYKKIFLIVFALFIAGIQTTIYIRKSSQKAKQGEILEMSTSIDYISDLSPSLIAFDKQGQVWVYESDDSLNKNGTLVVYKDRQRVAAYSEQDSSLLDWLPSRTSEIAFDASGKVWIGRGGEDGGLAYFDGSSWETYKSGSGLPDNWVNALAVDTQGRAWIGVYEHGLSIFDGKTWQTYTTENSGLPVDTVYDIAFDTEGRAWVATNRGGLVIFDGESWQTINGDNSGLASNFTSQIVFDDQERAWIDTEVDISVFDGKTWLHYPIEHNIESDMFFDGMGRLWAIRGMNIHVFDDGEWKYFFDPDSNFRPRVVDPQGNIWFENFERLVSVPSENVTVQSQSTLQRRLEVLLDSSKLTLVLLTLWVASALSAWRTMLISILIGSPIFLVWYWLTDSLLGANTPAEAAFWSHSYSSNPGVLITITILIGGMLGTLVKQRSGRKSAEWWGIAIGTLIGLILSCCLIFLAFTFMAK